MVGEMTSNIGFYHQMFLICLFLALFFFGVAVFLFWKLEIRNAFGYFSGRHAKKEIREIEKAAARRAAENSTTVLNQIDTVSPGDCVK